MKISFFDIIFLEFFICSVFEFRIDTNKFPFSLQIIFIPFLFTNFLCIKDKYTNIMSEKITEYVFSIPYLFFFSFMSISRDK